MKPVQETDNDGAVSKTVGIVCDSVIKLEREEKSEEERATVSESKQKTKEFSSGPFRKTKRLSSGGSAVQMGKDTSFRIRIAEAISKSIDKSVFDDVDDISYNNGSLASVANSRINVLQVSLSIGLLIVAVVMFVFIVAQDNGGFNNIEHALISSDSAVVAITVAMIMVPLSCICICISNVARRHQQKKKFFCCPNSFTGSSLYDPAKEVISSEEYVVSEMDVNSLV